LKLYKIPLRDKSNHHGNPAQAKYGQKKRKGYLQDQGSLRVVEELLAHPNIIKNLNIGQCVLLRPFPTRLDLLNVKYIDPKILWANVNYIQKKEGKAKTNNKTIDNRPVRVKSRGPLISRRGP
jgi:conjugal transfer pilus assembly protein TraD